MKILKLNVSQGTEHSSLPQNVSTTPIPLEVPVFQINTRIITSVITYNRCDIVPIFQRTIQEYPAKVVKQQQLSTQTIPTRQHTLCYNRRSSKECNVEGLQGGLNTNAGESASNDKRKREATVQGGSTRDSKIKKGDQMLVARTKEKDVENQEMRRLLCPYQVGDADRFPDCKCFKNQPRLQ